MNKKGKTNTLVWVVIIGIAVVVGYFFLSGGSVDTGTTDSDGWSLRLYDIDGNEILIPSTFSGFSIWTTEAPITCTTDAGCPGISTCWQGECVIRGVYGMALDFSVTSQSADVTYNNLHITSATPSAWSSALPSTSRTLAPSATTVFTSSQFSIPSAWEGGSQTFSVTMQGISDYDGSTAEDTRSITYNFYTDPTGGFTVNINNPFA